MFLESLKNSAKDLWKSKRPLCVVWLGVILYTTFFTTISFLRYNAFSYSDFDFAIFVHEAWKILHGSAEISLFNNTPIWGNALELISFVNAPLFFIFGKDPKSLLFLQSLALGVSAVPVFLIARRKIPEWLAAGLAIGYLFYPPIWYANLYEYNPLVYTTFTLLMAFYYLQGQRFGMFMFFIVLSIINRADLGIVTFMFGVYAFFERKSWKWVLWPSLISFLWVAVGLMVVIPAFKGSLSYDSTYPQFGKGFDQIIRNMILHPGILWQSLTTREDAKFFLEILYPVGFVSLFGIKEFLICGLSLIQHLASVRPQEHTILFHYTATISPFVYISAAYGLARLVSKRKRTVIICLLPFIFSLLANIFYGPISRYKEYIGQLKMDAEDVYKSKLLEEIPRNAPTVSTFEFSPRLAGRSNYYSIHYIYCGLFTRGVPYFTPSDIQYAFINFQDLRLLGFRMPDSDLKMNKFISDGNFGVVDKINSIALLKKDHVSSVKLYDIVTHAQPLQGGIAEAKNGARLWQVDSQVIQRRGHDVLSLTFHWGTTKEVIEDFWLAIAIFDPKDKQVFSQVRQIAYGLYPVARWAPGEEIVDHSDMLLPEGLNAGDYKVYVALLSVNVNQYIRIDKLDGNALVGKPQGNIMVATFHIPDRSK